MIDKSEPVTKKTKQKNTYLRQRRRLLSQLLSKRTVLSVKALEQVVHEIML
jgi:hypothetical protein